MTPLLQRLAEGDRRSPGAAAAVADMVLEQPVMQEELFDGLSTADAATCARIVRVLLQVAETDAALMQPYKDRVLHEWPDHPQWEIRMHGCQILPLLHLRPADVDAAYAAFETYLADRSSIVRTCAMQAMVDLLPRASERREEVTQRIQRLTETGTAAMRARGRHLLAHLDRTAR